MADETNNTTGMTEPVDDGQDDQIFSDLLRESRISSLQIEEPEFDSFDVQSVIREAKSKTKTPKTSRIFGKRSRKLFKTDTSQKDSSDTAFFSSKADASGSPASEYKSVSAALQEASKSREPAVVAASKPPAASSNKETVKETVEGAQQSPKAGAPEESKGSVPAHPGPLSTSSASHPAPRTPKAEKSVPQTFVEVLKGTSSTAVDEVSDEKNEKSEVSQEAQRTEASLKEEADSLTTGNRSAEPAEEPDDAVYDPSASLVDDYHYDEYEDKKHFSTTDYRKIEDYLNRESAQGFHYTRNDGNKYYFLKAKPHNYYYKVLYFAKEPPESYWNELEEEGWRRINQSPSRHKKDAGWYIVRNEKQEGELPKEIENEEEKYRYFSRLSKSCRSTMFLLFIVMVCSGVAVWLQYQFKGYLAVMIASAALFFIALWIFLVYARMLSGARKQASLLSARIRLAENDPDYQALLHAGESDQDLDKDWDSIDKASSQQPLVSSSPEAEKTDVKKTPDTPQ